MAPKRHFKGTSMALQWRKKKILGVADVDNFFMVFYKFEISMGDPTMWIVDEADCLS